MLLLGHVAAQTTPTLLVASRFSNQVLGYDAMGNATGSFAVGGVINPVGLTYGPDGHLYVAAGNSNQVLRFDGVTGAAMGVFAQGNGLSAPRQLNFGPDGNLYVCSGGNGRVLRFAAGTGTFLGIFAQSTAIAADTSMTFGPDFNLYVGSVTNNQVVKFDGVTGAQLGVFANTNMNGTHDLSFGPDGDLYVSNAFSNNVVRFDGRSGAFLGVFVQDPTLSAPLGLTWGSNGDLYLANQGGNDVRRYDGATGAFVSTFVAAGAGGLNGPLFTVFTRGPLGLQLTGPATPAGQDALFATTGAQPGCVFAIGLGTLPGPFPLPCLSLSLGIANPVVLSTASADEAGQNLLRVFVPASVQGLSFLFQAVDFTACGASPVVAHTF